MHYESFIWLSPVAGYLLGSFPTGVVLSRMRFGIDVREMGSGNIGATNITRNFGWTAGAIVFLLDFFKAWLPLALLMPLDSLHPWLVCSTGVAVVLGHCFSVFLGFSGGKGVASSLGCLTAVTPFAALISALTYVVGLSIARISAVGSLMGLAVAVGYVSINPTPTPHRWMVWLIALIVLLRHRSNLVRLWGGMVSR